jgi:hypothetical protein
MASMRVVAVMLDGTKHEAIGVYMALSDRVAFERLYNVSVVDLKREARNIDAEGNAQAPVPTLREEQTAYFTWRALTRGDCPVGGFEDFLEAVEEITLERLDGPVDPTVPAPAPGESPS